MFGNRWREGVVSAANLHNLKRLSFLCELKIMSSSQSFIWAKSMRGMNP